MQKGDWFKFPFIIEGKNDKSHGTVVEVKKLKIDLTAELLQKIKEELGRRFAPFILMMRFIYILMKKNVWYLNQI